MTGKCLTNAAGLVNNDFLQATDVEDAQLRRQFKLGDIAWIRIHEHSWWPVQVVDENVLSLRNKKKKAKDQVLVRLYGTYDYLYMNPVRCSSEFENNLKKENSSIREAFQKALEEDISCMISSGKSKRKASNCEENATAGTSRSKKQKQDRSVINQEANHSSSPGTRPSKSNEARTGQKEMNRAKHVVSGDKRLGKLCEARTPMEKEKINDEASKVRAVKQSGGRKTEKAKRGSSNIEITKQDVVRRTKKNVVKADPIMESSSTTKHTVQEETALEEIRDLDEVLSSMKSSRNSKRKISRSKAESSKGKRQKQDKMDGGQKAEVLASARACSVKPKKVGAKEEKENLGLDRKSEKHDARKLKETGVEHKGSKDESTRQVGAGKLEVTEKAKHEASTTRRTRCRQTKQMDVKENSKTESPCPAKRNVPEKTCLKKEISLVKSGGRSDRKTSRCEDKDSIKAFNGRKEKQDNNKRNCKADGRRSARAHANGSKKLKGVQKRKDEAGDKASIAEKTKQQCVGKSKVIEKSEYGISKDGSAKQGGVSQKVTEKAENGAKSRSTKQDHSRQSKQKGRGEESKTESYTPGQYATPGTADLSVRRMRVMRSLGLIAPLGSPFCRNGFIMTALENH